MKKILSMVILTSVLFSSFGSQLFAEEKSFDELKEAAKNRTLAGAEQQARTNSEKIISDYNAAREINSVYKEVYVSTYGNDNGDGSSENPFKTLQRAKEYVKDISPLMTGDVVVHIAAGTYYLDKPLQFLTEDSGKNGYKIIYSGDKDNMPVICGGIPVSGFKQSEEYPLLYEAELHGFEQDGIHTMLADGKMRYVAKSETWIDPAGNYKTPGTQYTSDGFYVNKSELGEIDNLSALELGYCDAWLESVIHVKNIKDDPSNKDRYIVEMENPTWDTLGSIGNRIYPSYAHSFVARNQFSLLDSPGEFYYDRNKSKLYYMPAEGESLNSEFIVPVLDFAMFFVGNDGKDKVKNITIENLKISGFKSVNSYNDLIIPGQALSATIRANETSSDGEMGTVHLDKAENINFFDNYFTGLGQIGLRMYNDCSSCMVMGNVFSDIGNSAIAVGNIINYTMLRDSRKENQKPKIFKNPNTDFWLNGKYPAISSSNTTVTPDERANGALHVGRGVETNYTSIQDLSKYKAYKENSYTWRSKPRDVGVNKSWVMYDFFREYDYSEVVLCFDPEQVTDEEKSGFEILLSNDKHFSEGSYEVAAVQKEPAGEVQRYKIDTDNKYRYVMIRTTENTPLALTFGYVFTADLPHGEREKMCNDITIADNYITRVCQERYADTGIFAYACDNAKIIHNSISYTPYSGISFGWGWGCDWYCGTNIDIGYNSFFNTMQMLQDGGSIYTLSLLYNSIVHDNYSLLSNAGVTYYHDQGSSGMFDFNNVGEISRCVYFSNATSLGTQKAFGNYKQNIYALEPNDTARYDGDYTEVNPNIEYTLGNEPKEAESIIKNAGVRGEYNRLVNQVKENSCNYSHWSGLTSFFERAVEIKNNTERDLNNVLQSGNFGFRHGMYSYPLKKELENMSKWSYSNNTEVMQMFDLVKRVKDGFNMPDFEDMLNDCEELIGSVKAVGREEMKNIGVNENAVYKSDYDSFRKLIDEIEEKAVDCTEEEKCVLRNELVALYDDFLGKTSAPYFDYIDIYGLEECTADKENRRILLKVNSDCDGVKDLKVFLGDNTKLASELSAVKIGGETKAVLYSKISGKYTDWTIETIRNGEEKVSRVEADMVKTDLQLDEIIKKSADGGAYFTGMKNQHAYYTAPCLTADTGVEVDFAVGNSNGRNEFTFMLGAEELQDFNPGDTDQKCDRIELSFKNKIMTVSAVTNGAKSVIMRVTSDVDYNTVNSMIYKLCRAGSNTKLTLTVNGKTSDYIIPGVYTGSAFGFYSYSNGVFIR